MYREAGAVLCGSLQLPSAPTWCRPRLNNTISSFFHRLLLLLRLRGAGCLPSTLLIDTSTFYQCGQFSGLRYIELAGIERAHETIIGVDQ